MVRLMIGRLPATTVALVAALLSSIPAVGTAEPAPPGPLAAAIASVDATRSPQPASRPRDRSRTVRSPRLRAPEASPQLEGDGAPRAFDVASVRQTAAESFGPSGLRVTDAGGLTMLNQRLLFVIRYAFDLPPHGVKGYPAWIESTSFDIEARPPVDGTAKRPIADVRAMLRALLVERFDLRFHFEKQRIQVYYLQRLKRTAPLGPNIRHVVRACPTDDQPPPPAGLIGRAFECGARFAFANGRALIEQRATAIPNFALALQRYLDRPVIDDTGLDGEFDIDLEFLPDDMPELFRVRGAELRFPVLRTALSEQLRLRLAGGSAEVEVLLIDGIKSPTPN